jgi:hypothetical protein
VTPVYKLSANSVKNGRTVYGSMLAGNTAYELPGDFQSIATVSVGSGGAANVEFTSIPATYQHLQLRFFARTNRSTYNADELYIYCNNDTTASNYAGHYLVANNNNFPGTVTAGGAANFITPYFVGANNGTGPFAGWVVDFLDYANTNKYKTVRGLGGADSNGDVATFCTVPMFNSSLWKNTNAITSIKVTIGLGTSLNQYSHFALYGIKAA